jgi:hypothetical protein
MVAFSYFLWAWAWAWLGFGVSGLEEEQEVTVVRRGARRSAGQRSSAGAICHSFGAKEKHTAQGPFPLTLKDKPWTPGQDDCSKGGIQSGLRTRALPSLLPSTSPLLFQLSPVPSPSLCFLREKGPVLRTLRQPSLRGTVILLLPSLPHRTTQVRATQGFSFLSSVFTILLGAGPKAPAAQSFPLSLALQH